MQSLFDLFATCRIPAVDTLVYVGAGEGADLDDWVQAAPRRLVVAEGEAQAAARLAERLVRWPGAEVHAVALAPRAGPVPWHRYNLPALNGPLQAQGLVAYYPRLRQLESVAIDATPVAGWLDGLGIVPAAGGKPVNVLVLDVPGQEHALLAALTSEHLQRFELVVVRGCREPLPDGGSPAAEAAAFLRCIALEATNPGDAADDLWPAAAYRLDRDRLAAEQQRRAELAGLQAAAHERDQALARCSAELEAMTRSKAEFERIAYERYLEIQRLNGSMAALQGAARDDHANGEALAALQHSEALGRERVAELTRTSDELARLSQEQAGRLRLLEPEAAKLKADLAASLQRTAELEAGNRSLLDQARDRDARQRRLDGEILKAEAQLELIKDVLLREKNF